MKKLISALLLFCSSFSAFAADYSWVVNQFPSWGPYDSAGAACDAYSQYYMASGGTLYKFTFKSLTMNSVTSYTCAMTRTTISSGATATQPSNVTRSGSTCKTGTTYNSATGQCDTPVQDKCQIAAAAGAAGSYTVKTNIDADPPKTIDINGCEATFGGVIVCKNKTDGTAQCTGTAKITGKKTEAVVEPVAGPGVECTGDDCLKDAPQYEENKQGCNYASNASTGTKTCTTKESTSNPGTTKCTQSGTSWTCTENPKSTSTDKTTNTTVEDKSNIDGSTETKQTDNTTVVSCKGIKNCSTTGSTTVTTGGTGSDGSTTNPSSSCLGNACNGASTGSNEGTGSDEGSEEGENVYPNVNGLTKPGDPGNFDDADAEWDEKIEDSKEQLKDKMEEFSDLFQPIEQMNLDAGNAELPCGETFQIPGGKTASICFGQYESQLTPLALAILFICALIALFIIFKPSD